MKFQLQVLQTVVLCCFTKSIVNALSSSEEADQAYVVDTCCTYGEAFAVTATSVKECSGAGPPDEIELEQEDICKGAQQRCCQEHFKKKDECTAGTKFAEAKRCTVAKGEIGKTCCEECQIGILTGETQGKDACGDSPGDDVSPNTALRKAAYHQCCLDAANKPEPTTPKPTTPKPTTTTRKPTTTTRRTTTSTTTEKPKLKCKQDSCQHLCNDDGGIITCACNEGFRLQADKKSCKDINECAEAIDDLCTGEGTVCHNTPGAFKCVPIKKRDVGMSCPPGFKRNVQKQVCDDINECQLPNPPCPKYLCQNTVGAYKCAGKLGKPFIEETPAPAPGYKPTQPEIPIAPSSKSDVVCPVGFRAGPDDECIDINECTEMLDDCQRLSQYCINTHGSYFCQDHVSKRCAPGFKVNKRTGICEDIDECEEGLDVCKRNEVCVNLPGEYRCQSKISTLPKPARTTCPEGTRLKPVGNTCEDIDECAEGTHLCDAFQDCINTHGGHECRCKNGFELNSAGNCEDVDECALKMDNCGPGFACVNTQGSFKCQRTLATTSSTLPPGDYEYYYSDEDNSTVDNELEVEPRPPTRPTAIPAPRPTAPPTTTPKSSPPKPTQPRPTTPRSTTPRSMTPKPTTPTPTTPKPTPPRPTTPKFTRPTYPSLPPEPTTNPPTAPTYETPPPPPPLPPRPNPSEPDYYRPETYRPSSTRTPYTNRPRPRPNVTRKPEVPLRRPEETTTAETSSSPKRPDEADNRPETPYYPHRPSDTTIPDTAYTPSRRPEYPYTPRKPTETTRPETPYTPHRPSETPTPENPYGPDEARRTEPPYLPRRPEQPVEVTVPPPTDPITIEKEKGADGSYNVNTAEIPKDRWTNVIGKEKPTTPTDEDFDANLHCLNGYVKNSEGECVDFDECAENTHICSKTEECVNREGGYYCNCRRGYKRRSNGKCEEDFPELPPTTERTTVTPPKPPTRPYIPPICDVGYEFNARERTCIDIDECSKNRASCSPKEECVNTQGGYQCTCGSTCRSDPISPSYVIPPRPHSNQITVGSEYGKRGERLLHPSYTRQYNGAAVIARCPFGYKLTDYKMCLDIDECARNTSECGPQQRCENFYGGYSCQCPEGHMVVGTNDCVDINECDYGQPCPYNSQCMNTVGSYRCECSEGFRNAPSNDKMCVDIDECSETPQICEQGCANAWGGYRCYCNKGYRISSDNRTCIDVDECAEWGSVRTRGRLCAGDCVNTPGSFRCRCPAGYRAASDNRSCIDIDECEDGTATCARGSPGEVCQNTQGSYHCHRIRCPDGYRLEARHRCTRIQRSCVVGDWSCLHQPSSYSYNFITFVANIYLPKGRVDLFTMHGPSWSDSVVEFELRMLDVQPGVGVRPADRNCFDMIPVGSVCRIALMCSLEGPQVVEMELTMALYTRGQFAGSAAARLVVIVSQFEF